MANISISNIKSYSRLRGEEKFVNQHGDNFANVVRVIFPKYPSFKLQYFEYLRKFMSIDYMDYEIVGDREVNLFMMVKDKRFDLNELSDGTARLLLLLFILCSPEKPKVLFIDQYSSRVAAGIEQCDPRQKPSCSDIFKHAFAGTARSDDRIGDERRGKCVCVRQRRQCQTFMP